MTELLDWTTRVGVFLLMLVVGTDCTWPGIRDALRRPGLAAVVVLGQFLIVPAVMYGCCRLLGVPIAVTGSLMLVACCPTGSTSNTYCYLARGNSSLSVALTILSCLVAIVATPAMLSFSRGILGTEASGLPLIPVRSLIFELVSMMLFPLLIGSALRSARPDLVMLHQRALRAAAVIIVVVVVTVIIGTNPAEVFRQLQRIALVAIAVTLVLLGGAWVVMRLFRLSREDRWAVLFEWPCRNLAIALIVGVKVLHRPDLVRFAAALFVIQAIVLLGVTWILGRPGTPRRAA